MRHVLVCDDGCGEVAPLADDRGKLTGWKCPVCGRREDAVPGDQAIWDAAVEWMRLGGGLRNESTTTEQARVNLDELMDGMSERDVLGLEWVRSAVGWREDGSVLERKAPGPEVTVRVLFRDPKWKDPRREDVNFSQQMDDGVGPRVLLSYAEESERVDGGVGPLILRRSDDRCRTCLGRGDFPSGERCPVCGGSGQSADAHHREYEHIVSDLQDLCKRAHMSAAIMMTEFDDDGKPHIDDVGLKSLREVLAPLGYRVVTTVLPASLAEKTHGPRGCIIRGGEPIGGGLFTMRTRELDGRLVLDAECRTLCPDPVDCQARNLVDEVE